MALLEFSVTFFFYYFNHYNTIIYSTFRTYHIQFDSVIGLSKQCRLISDAAERGVWYESTLLSVNKQFFNPTSRFKNGLVQVLEQW